MSYQDFTFGSALTNLAINWIIGKKEPQRYHEFFFEFDTKSEYVVGEYFQEEFQFSIEEYSETSTHNEEFLKNNFITLILRACLKRHRTLRLWYQEKLQADPEKDLTGTPDYLITKRDITPRVPYCIIAEANQMDFEKGWGQALSAMRGAQILNRKEADLSIPIYGIVTTGVLWQFGKLIIDEFAQYPSTYVNILEEEGQPVEVLKYLDIIFSESEKFVARDRTSL